MNSKKDTKTPEESKTIMTNIVLPNDTNFFNNMFGGQLLSWMDRASTITAERHSGSEVVTASVNNVSFEKPIPLSSIITIEAKVSRAFETSMEIYLDVWMENFNEKNKVKCNEAIYTFVAVDENNKPLPVPKIAPQTQLEKDRYDSALRRKQLSLVLAGKMKPQDATELKALFV